MNGKRKSHTEESPALSAAEDSDSAPPARKKQRNGHDNGEIVLDDDEMNGVEDDVKPEHGNGNGVQADDNADNSSEDEEEKDYVDEENEEGQLIRRYKRRVVKLERGSDG